MTDIHITKGEALVLLADAVKEKGADYVYTRPVSHKACVYTDGNENPSCIVGYALLNAGVSFDVLKAIDFGGAVHLTDWDDEKGDYLDEPVEVEEADGLGDTGIHESEVLYWLRKNGVEIDEPAVALFSSVQHEQDNGTPWGEAVTKSLGVLTNGRI